MNLLYFQVYTSGKGSSAAGLTASVMRDPHSVSISRIAYCVDCHSFVFHLNHSHS